MPTLEVHSTLPERRPFFRFPIAQLQKCVIEWLIPAWRLRKWHIKILEFHEVVSIVTCNLLLHLLSLLLHRNSVPSIVIITTTTPYTHRPLRRRLIESILQSLAFHIIIEDLCRWAVIFHAMRPPERSTTIGAVIFGCLLLSNVAVLADAQQKRLNHHEHHSALPRGKSTFFDPAGQEQAGFDALAAKQQKQQKETTQSHPRDDVRALATLAPVESAPATRHVRAPPAQRSGPTAGLITRQTARSLQDWEVEDLVLLAVSLKNVQNMSACILLTFRACSDRRWKHTRQRSEDR